MALLALPLALTAGQTVAVVLLSAVCVLAWLGPRLLRLGTRARPPVRPPGRRGRPLPAPEGRPERWVGERLYGGPRGGHVRPAPRLRAVPGDEGGGPGTDEPERRAA